MASYEIAFTPSVEKDLRIVSAKVRARILSRIAGLREEPIPRQTIELAGGHAWYRSRVGTIASYMAWISARDRSSFST